MKFVAVAFATVIAGLMHFALPISALADDPGVTAYSVEADFADVRLDLADAVINRGFVIDYEAMIGDMLQRTAADVGANKTIYKDAQTVQFCSATLSRSVMEADPSNIAFCPYVLFVYERADRPGTVTVGFRRQPESGSDESRKALAAVNALLDEIAREAAGM